MRRGYVARGGMMASAYNELLDKYHEVEVGRRGTKYKILTVMVCKTLEEQSVVVYDERP